MKTTDYFLMKKEQLNQIEFCRFKRKLNSKWEWGLLLNHGNLGILDKFGKTPKEIYNLQISINEPPVSLIDNRITFKMPKEKT